MGIESGETEGGLKLRQWMTAADIASDDISRTWQWGTGQKPLVVRLILLALGHAAACASSAVVSTDPDQLALLSGTAPEAASAAVWTLLRDNEPLIVPAPHPAPGPACWLRIPQNYREAAASIRRRAGSLAPLHPAFLVLGPAAGLTYASLSNSWQSVPDTARQARLSHTTVRRALKSLQDHGLAVTEITRPSQWDRRGRCWRTGPAELDEVALETGASHAYEQRLVKYGGDPGSVRWPYIPRPTGDARWPFDA